MGKGLSTWGWKPDLGDEAESSDAASVGIDGGVGDPQRAGGVRPAAAGGALEQAALHRAQRAGRHPLGPCPFIPLHLRTAGCSEKLNADILPPTAPSFRSQAMQENALGLLPLVMSVHMR
jgi:hypothetical protein